MANTPLIDLTNRANVVAYARITDPDLSGAVGLNIDRLVTAASDSIRTLVARNLVKQTYTAELYDGSAALRGGSRLYLREFPVNTVSAVTENGVALTVSAAYSLTADVIVKKADGILVRQGAGVYTGSQTLGQWSDGVSNITVTYDAGYDYPRISSSLDLPWDLEQAATELAGLMFKEGQRIGEGSKNFQGWTLQYIRTLNPMIANVIQAYERSFRP